MSRANATLHREYPHEPRLSRTNGTDGGCKAGIAIERLRGLMWRDKMELRLQGYASRRAAEEARRAAHRPKVKVLVIDLGEYRHRGIAAS